MIVPMKKVHIVLQKKDADQALEVLRNAGVVHIEPLKTVNTDLFADLEKNVERLEVAVEALKNLKGEKPSSLEVAADVALEHVSLALENQKKLNEDIFSAKNFVSQWESWGNFEPGDFLILKEQGFYLSLAELPLQALKDFPQDVTVEVIAQTSAQAKILLIDRENREYHVPTMVLPEGCLEDAQTFLEASGKKQEKIEAGLLEWMGALPILEEALVVAKEDLVFGQTKEGMADAEDLQYLKGFCPGADVAHVEGLAKDGMLAVLISDPHEDEVPPTLLKNPKWVELIAPVFKVIEIVPGYKEFDVSLVFLVFFTLFFAILIGDAAYGLIFAGATFFAHKKMGNQVKDQAPFVLMYLLTFFTIVWGVLTGTFFGQQWLPSFIKPVFPWLNNFQNMQSLCFMIALVHLSIAKIWSMIRRFPSITFLADVGWLLIVWGMFFVANMFVLGRALPGFVLPLFYVGIPLAFFFMVEPNKFLKACGQEFVPFVLGVVGAGTDIVSYIRLFAVGLATVAVADATNTMASGLPVPAMVLVLVIGHGLNLVLAVMAILVHAIRLNVLEFSGQLGLEWSGYEYQPFRSNK